MLHHFVASAHVGVSDIHADDERAIPSERDAQLLVLVTIIFHGFPVLRRLATPRLILSLRNKKRRDAPLPQGTIIQQMRGIIGFAQLLGHRLGESR